MVWTVGEKAFVVELFFTTKSINEIRRQFSAKFKTSKSPNKIRIYQWVWRFREHGSVVNGKSSGRPRQARSAQNIALVEESVTEHLRH